MLSRGYEKALRPVWVPRVVLSADHPTTFEVIVSRVLPRYLSVCRGEYKGMCFIGHMSIPS